MVDMALNMHHGNYNVMLDKAIVIAREPVVAVPVQIRVAPLIPEVVEVVAVVPDPQVVQLRQDYASLQRTVENISNSLGTPIITKGSRVEALLEILRINETYYTPEAKALKTIEYEKIFGGEVHSFFMTKKMRPTDHLLEPELSGRTKEYDTAIRLIRHFAVIENQFANHMGVIFGSRGVGAEGMVNTVGLNVQVTKIAVLLQTLGADAVDWFTNLNLPKYHDLRSSYELFKKAILLQFTPPDTDSWAYENFMKQVAPGNYDMTRITFSEWYYDLAMLRKINSPARVGLEITAEIFYQRLSNGLPAVVMQEFTRLKFDHLTSETTLQNTAAAVENQQTLLMNAQNTSNPAYMHAMEGKGRGRWRPRQPYDKRNEERYPRDVRYSEKYPRDVRYPNQYPPSQPKRTTNPRYVMRNGALHVVEDVSEKDSDTETDSDVSEEDHLDVVDGKEVCAHNVAVCSAMSAEKYDALLQAKEITGSCNNCGKMGHWARSCPEKKSDRSFRSPNFRRFNGRGQDKNKFVRFSDRSNRIKTIPTPYSGSASDALKYLKDQGMNDLLLVVDGNQYFVQA